MSKELELKMKKSREIAEMVQKYFVEEIGFKNKIEIAYSSDEFTLNVYTNSYDYNILTVKIEDGVPEFEYLSRAVYLNSNHNKLKFHKAPPEEIYVSKLLKQYKTDKLHIIEGSLTAEDGLYDVDLSEVKYMNYDKTLGILEIIETSDESMEINFKNETITWTNQEPKEKGEPLTLEFLQKVITAWNDLYLRHSLSLEDETIFAYDKHTDKTTELIALDDIDKVTLLDGILTINLDPEDENGFTSYVFSKGGLVQA